MAARGPGRIRDLTRLGHTRFGRGERFVYEALPREEFDDTLAQVKRWGLDQYVKDRAFEQLSYPVGR